MLRPLDFLQKATRSGVPGVSSRFTSVTSQPIVNPMSGKIAAEARVKNRVSGHEKNIGKGINVVPRASGESITKKEDETAIELRYVEERYGFCVVHINNRIK